MHTEATVYPCKLLCHLPECPNISLRALSISEGKKRTRTCKIYCLVGRKAIKQQVQHTAEVHCR